MTDSPTPPAPPATAPATKPPVSARRMLLIAIAIGLVVGAAAFFGVRVGLNALNSFASGSQTEVVDEAAEDGEVVLLPYTSEAEGYSIVGPGEPTVVESPGTSNGYDVMRIKTKWALGGEGTFVAYFVGTADFSAMAADGAFDGDFDVDAFLDDAVDRIAAQFTVHTREKTTLFGEPAVSGVLDFGDGAPQRFLVVLHNNVQYMLTALETDDDIDETFIASFTFLD